MNPISAIDQLYKHLSSHTSFPVDEWKSFQKELTLINLKKGETLFSQGSDEPIVGFVLKGLGYSYYICSNGNQHTKRFYWKGTVISPWAAALQQKECNFSAQAIEDMQILTLKASTMRNFEQRHHCWVLLSKWFTELAFIERERREHESLTLSLSQRYQLFTTRFSEYVPRIPQYLIASYLGVNAVTLSRIKSNMK